MSKAIEEIKYITYAESWYRTWCPYCKDDNWHCNGNENDLSGLDVEAIKCRSCKQTYRLGVFDEIDEEIRGGGTLITEDGIKIIEDSPQPREKNEPA